MMASAAAKTTSAPTGRPSGASAALRAFETPHIRPVHTHPAVSTSTMSVLRALTPLRAVRGLASQSVPGRTAAVLPRTFATSSSSRAEEKDPQLGDYPDVPARSYQSRRYDKSWWDPQEKRNFGEIVSTTRDRLFGVGLKAGRNGPVTWRI